MAVELRVKSGVSKKPARIVIYGTAKVGKTSFAAGAEKPIFILTEGGQGLLDLTRFEFDDTGRDIARFPGEVFSALTALATTDHDFKTVVIDSISVFEKLVWKEIANQNGEETIASNKKGSPLAFGRGYGLALNYWHQLTKALDYLVDAKGIGCILIAHPVLKRHDSPDTDAYDKYNLDINGLALEHLIRWADAILFAAHKTYVEVKGDSFGKPITKGVDAGRVLYTVERPAAIAGNRLDLPPELPFKPGSAYRDYFQAIGTYKPHAVSTEQTKEKKNGAKKATEQAAASA